MKLDLRKKLLSYFKMEVPISDKLPLIIESVESDAEEAINVTQTKELESGQAKALRISPISVNRKANPTKSLPLKHRQSAKTWKPDLASPDKRDIDQGNNARPKNNRWSSSLRRSASEELQSAQLQRDTQRPKTSKDRSLNFYSAWSM